MIKKVISITLLIFCLKLIPLFSFGVYFGTAPALHPVVMSPDIMLIEERARLGFDVKSKRFKVELELVFENSGEAQRAKARFRTGGIGSDASIKERGVNYSSKFNVNVNGKLLSYDIFSELSSNDYYFEDVYYLFEADYINGRNIVTISFYEAFGGFIVDSYSTYEWKCELYLEDIYKQSLKKFSLELYSINGNVVVKGVPYKMLDSAVSFDSYTTGSRGSNRAASSNYHKLTLINEGESLVFNNHKFRLSSSSLFLNVYPFSDNSFKYMIYESYIDRLSPILFAKEQRLSLKKDLSNFSFAGDFIDYSKEFDMKQLDSRGEEFLDVIYYYFLAGFRSPFPNRAKVREAFNKVPFYFPDENFTFNSLSEQAQQRFLMLNSYRNNRLQPESYQPFVKNLRVRSEPGLKGKVVGKLALFKQVKLLERGELTEIDGLSGNWVLIEDSRGLKGWCFDGYMEGM